MSETEINYWQAIVDDQRVATERLSEALTETRAEIARLREIVAAVALHLKQIEGTDLGSMSDSFELIKRLVNEYHDSKTV
jgi:uncharacterized coiled-coil protein SlyX